MNSKQTESPNQVVIERTFRAPIEDVWELWTTKDGIESWWGPEGFSVVVRKLELRPQGELLYAMSATDPQTIAFMKREGMPVTTECRITFTEVEPLRRLTYINLADFIPGQKAYQVGTRVELQQTSAGVQLTLTLDRMHNEEWTQRAVMGWESELGKLEKVLVARPRAEARP